MFHSVRFSALLAAALLAGCVKWGEVEETAGGPTTVAGQVLAADRQVAVPRPPQVQVWGRAQGTGAGTIRQSARPLLFHASQTLRCPQLYFHYHSD